MKTVITSHKKLGLALILPQDDYLGCSLIPDLSAADHPFSPFPHSKPVAWRLVSDHLFPQKSVGEREKGLRGAGSPDQQIDSQLGGGGVGMGPLLSPLKSTTVTNNHLKEVIYQRTTPCNEVVFAGWYKQTKVFVCEGGPGRQIRPFGCFGPKSGFDMAM